VEIESEPAGAEVLSDGAPVGTTPAMLTLDYRVREGKLRRRHCGVLVPLTLADVGLGVAGLWAAVEYTNKEPALMLGSAFYGGLGFLSGLGWTAACWSDGTDSPTVLPERHSLALRYGDFTEPLEVEVPTPSDSGAATVSRVIRGQEEADWKAATGSDSIEAYTSYLDTYPSGRWREEAERAIAELLWRAAQGENTLDAYARYLVDERTEAWRERAEAAVGRLLEQTPDCAERERVMVELRARLEAPCARFESPICDVRGEAEITTGYDALPGGGVVRSITTVYSPDCAEKRKREACQTRASEAVGRMARPCRQSADAGEPPEPPPAPVSTADRAPSWSGRMRR